MFAPFCPKCPADLTCLFSSPPSQKNWQRLCRALSSWLRPSKETARSKFHWLEGTALTVTAETIWQLHKQDSCARCYCLAGADVDSNVPVLLTSHLHWASLSLFSSSKFPTCSHWMAPWPTSKSFTLWAQPLISHHPLHPLLYSSHIEPTSIPKHTIPRSHGICTFCLKFPSLWPMPIQPTRLNPNSTPWATHLWIPPHTIHAAGTIPITLCYIIHSFFIITLL